MPQVLEGAGSSPWGGQDAPLRVNPTGPPSVRPRLSAWPHTGLSGMSEGRLHGWRLLGSSPATALSSSAQLSFAWGARPMRLSSLFSSLPVGSLPLTACGLHGQWAAS
jgi:hypothetical protein